MVAIPRGTICFISNKFLDLALPKLWNWFCFYLVELEDISFNPLSADVDMIINILFQTHLLLQLEFLALAMVKLALSRN